LQVARWMAEQGAQHIVLMGRTPLPPRAEWDKAEAGGRLAQQIAAIRDIESLGAAVQLATVDVSDEAQMRAFLDAYRREGRPAIRGIAHAAGILKHRSLIECDAAELKDVMRAKVAGGWLLHRLLGDALDFFVMFSSASSLLSSPRLGSYAAGNAFLDGLAHYRQARGLPAVSANWGVWADAGMAAQFDSNDVALIALRGMGTISTKQGLDALGRLMQQDAAQVGVLPVNWKRWQELYPAFVDAPFLAHVVRRAEKVVEAKTPGLTREALIAASDRQATLQVYLAALVSKTMGVAELDPQQPLSELGLDSLMAVEMKNRIEAELAIVVPMVKFLQGPSVSQLTAQVLDQLAAVSSAEVKRPDRDDERTKTERLLANLDQLSDDQVDSLLNELLSAEGHANE
jgi:acyl carrier protein